MRRESGGSPEDEVLTSAEEDVLRRLRELARAERERAGTLTSEAMRAAIGSSGGSCDAQGACSLGGVEFAIRDATEHPGRLWVTFGGRRK